MERDALNQILQADLQRFGGRKPGLKDALLRNDSTIGGVMNAMTSAMMQSYTVNGKTYSLSSFGIHTMGYLNSAKNENYAYHIDGDEDDSITSGNTDKLLDMITNNPEDVEEFMKQLTSGLYTALDNKMKSTSRDWACAGEPSASGRVTSGRHSVPCG